MTDYIDNNHIDAENDSSDQKTEFMTVFDSKLAEIDTRSYDGNKLFEIAEECLCIKIENNDDEETLLKKINIRLLEIQKKGTKDTNYALHQICQRINKMVNYEKKGYSKIVHLIPLITKRGPSFVRDYIKNNNYHLCPEGEDQLLNTLDAIYDFCYNKQQHGSIEELREGPFKIDNIMYTIQLQKKTYLKQNLRIWILKHCNWNQNNQ